MVWAVSLSTMDLITHSLTPTLIYTGIRILVGFSTSFEALVHPVIYLPQKTCEASPKAISERTSYHGVWLAFHPYPQLIQTVFNL